MSGPAGHRLRLLARAWFQVDPTRSSRRRPLPRGVRTGHRHIHRTA